MGGMIEALLFDFDGTLVDTESTEHRAWQEAYRDHGVELTLERYSAGIGTLEGFDAIAHLEELLGASVDRGAVDEARRERERVLLHEQELREGVEAYLDEAHTLGLRVAIVSSSSESWIEGNLERIAVTRDWACIVCANGDAARAKPTPTLYLEALETLGVSADRAIAFEDSPNGVTAARAAGIYCVAVPNPVTAALDLSHADLVVGSLAEIPLRELLSVVEDARAA
jgi:HAD superfamily hydrolase (TIGR01509 family)